MYAVEFEADVTSPFIELPYFEKFMNQRVKIIILYDREPAQNASKTQDDLVGVPNEHKMSDH
jgi:hypothetical protein